MSDIHIANIALNGAGIVLTLIVISFIYRKAMTEKRNRYVMYAGILHFVTLCTSTYIEFSDEREHIWENSAHYISIVFLRIVALGLLVCCIVMESDDRIRFFKRKEPISIKMTLAVFLPVVIGLTIQAFVIHFRVLGFLMAISLLLVHELLEYSHRIELNNKEEILNIRQAKLMAEQMQPHFIYNSLMSIHYLICTDPEKAAQCIQDFTGYLRGNIDALTTEDPIAFSKELEHIDQYVSLERASTDREFEMIYDLKSGDFKIPALTVQPIVENAVKHGALSRKDATGFVRITTETIGEFVRITIEDNGGGTSLTEKQINNCRIGIRNARLRLDAQCGGTLTINSSENGTRAVITVPKEAV